MMRLTSCGQKALKKGILFWRVFKAQKFFNKFNLSFIYVTFTNLKSFYKYLINILFHF